MMKLPVFSIVANTSQDATARNIIQSLLVTILMFGVTEVPVYPQVDIKKVESKIEQPDRTIKVNLKRSGVKDEWLVVKIGNDDAGQTVNVFHTSQVKNEFFSTLTNVVTTVGIGLLLPLPTPEINFYGWADHPTQRLTFIPEGCDATILDPKLICVIKGTDTLRLPTGMKIEAGQLTIEYLEESLVRSVTLNVPSE